MQIEPSKSAGLTAKFRAMIENRLGAIVGAEVAPTDPGTDERERAIDEVVEALMSPLRAAIDEVLDGVHS